MPKQGVAGHAHSKNELPILVLISGPFDEKWHIRQLPKVSARQDNFSIFYAEYSINLDNARVHVSSKLEYSSKNWNVLGAGSVGPGSAAKSGSSPRGVIVGHFG